MGAINIIHSRINPLGVIGSLTVMDSTIGDCVRLPMFLKKQKFGKM